MRTLSKLLVLAASVAVSTSLAYADDIGPGSISIGQYNASYDSSNNTVEFMSGGSSGYSASAADGFGSLTAFDSGTVTFGNLTGSGSGTYTFDLNTTGPLSASPLLTITENGSTLTYDLTSVTMISNGGNDINIDTMGTFTESGTIGSAGPTVGSLDLTTQDSALTTYSGEAAIAPEPSSLLLFGTGLLGAAGIARRKFAGRFV